MLTPNGGVFGRNPTFNNVTVENNLTVNGDFTLGDDIVINDTLLVNGVATFRGGIISIPNSAAPTSNTVLGLLAGNALASGAVQNVLIGSDAGRSIINSDFNVAVGSQALRGFDAALNTAVGYNAMGAFASGNTGALNTAVGYNAGASLRAGGTNVAVGNDAGSTNQNANNTVAVGAQAALLNTASDITAVGANALDANTTGVNNTAVGKDALGANTTGNNNVAFGKESLRDNVTGANNTAVGQGALALHTGSGSTAVGFTAALLSTASDITAVGANALDANTTGAQNTAVGKDALTTNTTASFNVAVGNQALMFTGTGGNNTAVGTNSLQNNTTGTNNTAIGLNALQACSTVSDLTAVGAGALDANTTGTNNTAVGKDALGANTTGSNNIAVGGACLDVNTTGTFNVAVGYDALGACVSGSTNTAIGQGALGACLGSQSTGVGTNTGLFVTTGNSVFVGSNAGLFFGSGSTPSDYVTSADESMFIGRNTRPAANSQSNQIVIGNNAIGNGSNTTTIGNSSTTNTFIAGGDLRVAGGIRAVNAANPTFNPPAGHSAALYVPTGIGTLTDAVVVGNPNQSATLRMTHNGASATQCSFGRLSPTGTFDEHLRVIGTTAASAVTSVFGTTASTSTSTGALVVSGGVGVAGAIYPGDNIVMASGKGIDFSATANSSGTMTSELLSDYEEGTWTPTLTFGGASVGITYGAAVGVYTKIGNVVTLHIRVLLTSKGSSSGSARIENLPFTGRSGLYQSVNASYQSGVTAVDVLTGYVDSASTLIYLSEVASGVVTNVNQADFSNDAQIIIQATYYV